MKSAFPPPVKDVVTCARDVVTCARDVGTRDASLFKLLQIL